MKVFTNKRLSSYHSQKILRIFDMGGETDFWFELNGILHNIIGPAYIQKDDFNIESILCKEWYIKDAKLI